MKQPSMEEMAPALMRDMIGGFIMQVVQARAQVEILTAQVKELQRQLSELKTDG